MVIDTGGRKFYSSLHRKAIEKKNLEHSYERFPNTKPGPVKSIYPGHPAGEKGRS